MKAKITSRSFAAGVLCLFALPVVHAAELAPGDPPIRQRAGILVDIKGRGLYTFDNDTQPGKSTCNNQCRLLWPPLLADDGAIPKGPFTLARRDDGNLQWAYKGKPLYRWASDKGRGDAGGARVSHWHLVTLSKPAVNVPLPVPGAMLPTAKPAPTSDEGKQ